MGLVGILVYSLFVWSLRHVDETQWAKDIAANRRYSSVMENEKDYGVKTDDVATFPTRYDVLFENRYGSR